MSIVDHNKLRAVAVSSDPFEHFVIPRLVTDGMLTAVMNDFPKVSDAGSMLVAKPDCGPAFRELVETLRGPEVRNLLSEKFSLDLREFPTMVTVRGWCRARDGRIHTDSKEKIVTVLLYLNRSWEEQGGRLRLLRQGADIEDYVVEVPPDEGTLLAFKCSDRAWHGHKSFEGERRTVQLNWVSDERYVRREERRHKISTFLKWMGLAN